MFRVAFIVLAFASCSHTPVLTIGKEKVVVGPSTSSATLEKGETHTTLAVPADTRVTTTHVDPVPATPTTPFVPATTRTEWTFLRPTTFDVAASTLAANSGVIDTTLAQHQIDVTSKQPYLWASIACVVLAIVGMFMKYPTCVLLCGVASGVFFAMWKLSDMPSWLVAVGAACVAGAIFLVVGHEKGERTVPAPSTPVVPATT